MLEEPPYYHIDLYITATHLGSNPIELNGINFWININ